MDKSNFFEIFKSTKESDLLDLSRELIFQGIPYVFSGDKKAFFLFRKRISDFWNIHYQDIYITGSAALGFSIYKDTVFSLDSDIDVAIVSNDLFETILKDIHLCQLNLRSRKVILSERDTKAYHKFLEYIAMGWIRPDLLPTNLAECIKILKDQWFNFFSSISNGNSEVGNYVVAAGVFKSHLHLEQYTLLGLKAVHLNYQIGNSNDTVSP
ncbi:hypothetical protein M2R48_02975 [Acinetobacter sp. I-MWF]|uniref:hypothetical protein n=1 Tax=Acinetobacter sp. I-MWF TaxID=2940517 RepID=UPI0021CA4CA0|nr:hypothetical protein [Acinetobacter sp. I-MWF]MCT9977297.1 hypothetical protein [Acinetobacter sp. I-MWF]